ncbi:ScbA/BarX family gamma-butyrolactone biosynthesis protein [Dactylosporangium maewongense]|uniref:ScbA/BarX family gamma-butyrolactone biosynthesis protein n=1 Tax=Dactylosporangium maewongense TaxID=634393 RepID=A0ABP4LLF7_9ACTN
MSTPLRYATTVDRTLLHRRHAGETFLADLVPTGDGGFVAAALLPPAHPHYGGHTGPSRDLDPMLLLECARQAETYAAHVLFGVPAGDRFVLREWSARFPVTAPGDDPTELELTAGTGGETRIGGRLSGLSYDFGLWARHAWVGQVRMDVRYVTAAAYASVRRRARPGGDPPPSSDGLPPTPGVPVDPRRVGRLRATDAVLLDVGAAGGPVTARLRVPVENPSLFDHAQDHVPAMVLTEAARQLAVLATHAWGGAGPDRTSLVALDATFARYAELDLPLTLTAEPVGAGPAGWTVDVRCTQSGADVATARITVAAAHRSPR